MKYLNIALITIILSTYLLIESRGQIKKIVNHHQFNSNCMDTLRMYTLFPLIPFGVRGYSRRWITKTFKISKQKIKFIPRRNIDDPTFVDSLYTLNVLKSKLI